MIETTPYFAAIADIDSAVEQLGSLEPGKQVINQPTGRFFYDPWEIKSELKGTVWENILLTLPFPIGEARIITLSSKSNYVSHSDIDDRYHLNLSGVLCYLIDIDNKIMHPLEKDGVWYSMDASRLHTAANFGNRLRHQLVVRKLLRENELHDPISVKIIPTIEDLDEARFAFDHNLSSILNKGCKDGVIDNFRLSDAGPEFNCEKYFLDELNRNLTEELRLEIV